MGSDVITILCIVMAATNVLYSLQNFEIVSNQFSITAINTDNRKCHKMKPANYGHMVGYSGVHTHMVGYSGVHTHMVGYSGVHTHGGL